MEHMSQLLLERIRKFHTLEENGTVTQNVMAACDFDLLFTFIMAGWECAAHDTHIFLDTIRGPSANFPKPPPSIVLFFSYLL
jgi:hypothetical protein